MKHWIQLQLVRYLRRHGWIVFWLDEPSRHCNGICWLKVYLEDKYK